MRAGKRKHVVDIQSVTVTKAADGTIINTWADLLPRVWASISTSGGREFFRARQINSELTHELEILYKSTIKPAMRVLWGTRVLRIESVIQDDDKHKFTLLHCREING